MHSVEANNQVSIILGLGDTAIKEEKGKSAGKYLFDNIFRTNDFEEKK